jgi:uncharacterized lipoprotein
MKRHALAALWILGPPLIGLGACSREQALMCGRDSLYLEAQTIGPLQIPDDLSVPDASDNLVSPQAVIVGEETEADGCLEYSPAFRDAE